MQMAKQVIDHKILQESINHVLFGKERSLVDYSINSEKCTTATHVVFSQKHCLDKRIVIQKKKCPICLEYISSTVCVVQCGHIFHEECEKTWWTRSKTCAVCRGRVNYKAVLTNFWGAYVLSLEVQTLKRYFAKVLEMRNKHKMS